MFVDISTSQGTLTCLNAVQYRADKIASPVRLTSLAICFNLVYEMGWLELVVEEQRRS